MHSKLSDCPVSVLTDDALLHIFSYLTLPDKGRVARVCKWWNTMVSNPVLWQTIDLWKLIRKNENAKPLTSDWYWTFPRNSSSVQTLLQRYAGGSLKQLRIHVTVNDEIRKLLKNRCLQLESLEIEIDGNEGDLSFLPDSLQHLHLALSPSTKWRSLSLDLLPSYTHMQSVSLRYVKINYDMCRCLIQSGKIRIIKLDGCSWQVLTSEFRLLSEYLSQLQELYLISCHFPSPSCIYGIIHHISTKCNNLEKFELNQPFIIGYQRVGLSHRLDGILEAIGNCRTQLTSLKIAATLGLTLNGLATVTTLMTNLQELSLVSCVDITNEYLQVISNFNLLKFLDFSGCKRITDKGLRYFCHHKNLQELRVYGCTCLSEDAILLTIKTLPEIKNLTLPGWRGYDVCADLLQAQRPRLKVRFW